MADSPFVRAILSLLGSRKFVAMCAAQLAIAIPAVFGHVNPERAADLGVALLGVWMAAHAHEERGKASAPLPPAPAPSGDPPASEVVK